MTNYILSRSYGVWRASATKGYPETPMRTSMPLSWRGWSHKVNVLEQKSDLMVTTTIDFDSTTIRRRNASNMAADRRRIV